MMIVAFIYLSMTLSANLDADFDASRVRLGASRPQITGKLSVDGEGACSRLPYSACGYTDGQYYYYFSDGILVLKEFRFDGSHATGPYGINRSDGLGALRKKLSKYQGIGKIRTIGDDTVAIFQSGEGERRLEVRRRKGVVETVSVSIPDFL
jgi:hypothetical protein